MNLTLFYLFWCCYLCQVSRIQEIVGCLLEYQEEVLLADVTPTEILTVIMSINTILEVSQQQGDF